MRGNALGVVLILVSGILAWLAETGAYKRILPALHGGYASVPDASKPSDSAAPDASKPSDSAAPGAPIPPPTIGRS